VTATKRDYPTIRYAPDGFSVVLNAPEDLATLPPGYGRSPSGPFPGIDLAALPWDIPYGPFTGRWGRDFSIFVPGQYLVAPEDVIVERRVYWQGALIPTPRTLVQEALMRVGHLWEVAFVAAPPYERGWYFMDAAPRDRYQLFWGGPGTHEDRVDGFPTARRRVHTRTQSISK
jgi:hypothetical protein